MAKYVKAEYLAEKLGVSRQRVHQLLKARGLELPEVKRRDGAAKWYQISDLNDLARQIRSFNSEQEIKKISSGSKLVTIQDYATRTGMGYATIVSRLKVVKQRSPKDLPALAGKARRIANGSPSHFYEYNDLNEAIKLSGDLLKQRGRPKKF